MAAAVAFPANEIGLISELVLGFDPRSAQAVSDAGWEDLEDLHLVTTKQIEEWAKGVSTRSRQPIPFNPTKTRKLCALNYWVNLKKLQGLGLDPADFDANELLLAMADYPIHDQALTQEGTTDKPAKFKLENWEEWSELIINYLKGQKSVNPGRALSYVLRIEPRPATMLPSVFNNIIYNAPLVGAAYEADNIKVHTVLVELTTGTPAADWIKQYSRAQDGRGAWLALVRHYDGASEGTRRVSAAKNDLELCRYSNEFTFPFEQYITNLKRCYTTLEKYGEARTERDKIDS